MIAVGGVLKPSASATDESVLLQELENRGFDVAMLGLGYVYYLGPFASLAPGIGFQAKVGLVEGALEPFYATRVPVGGMVFMQLRPAAMPR